MEKEQILNKLTTVQVQDYVSFIPDLLEYLKNKVSNFQAGRLSSYVEQWKMLTSDEFILDMVTEAHIELLTTPFQVKCPQKKLFSSKERLVIDSEIKSLLAKGVIVPSDTEPGEYISPIFITPKKDGSYRMILNLKQFNEHVAYHHFKMDTLASAISMMKPHCFNCGDMPKWRSVFVSSVYFMFYWLFFWLAIVLNTMCAVLVMLTILYKKDYSLKTHR